MSRFKVNNTTTTTRRRWRRRWWWLYEKESNWRMISQFIINFPMWGWIIIESKWFYIKYWQIIIKLKISLKDFSFFTLLYVTRHDVQHLNGRTAKRNVIKSSHLQVEPNLKHRINNYRRNVTPLPYIYLTKRLGVPLCKVLNQFRLANHFFLLFIRRWWPLNVHL